MHVTADDGQSTRHDPGRKQQIAQLQLMSRSCPTWPAEFQSNIKSARHLSAHKSMRLHISVKDHEKAYAKMTIIACTVRTICGTRSPHSRPDCTDPIAAVCAHPQPVSA